MSNEPFSTYCRLKNPEWVSYKISIPIDYNQFRKITHGYFAICNNTMVEKKTHPIGRNA